MVVPSEWEPGDFAVSLEPQIAVNVVNVAAKGKSRKAYVQDRV